MVNMADTVVLVTVVYDKNLDSGRDFFPLTVDYQEKTYAAGKMQVVRRARAVLRRRRS